MNILIVFPTQLEAAEFTLPKTAHSIEIFISGIACYNTLYSLTKYCTQKKPDLLIHAGIAGSFSESYPPVSVVHVIEDCFADVGVAQGASFKNIFSLQLADKDAFPFNNGFLQIPFVKTVPQLPQVRGVTVNRISASVAERALLENSYHPDIETMEGAAVHFICLQESIPCIHIRAISNMVGERNKNTWRISDALKQAHRTVSQIIRTIE